MDHIGVDRRCGVGHAGQRPGVALAGIHVAVRHTVAGVEHVQVDMDDTVAALAGVEVLDEAGVAGEEAVGRCPIELVARHGVVDLVQVGRMDGQLQLEDAVAGVDGVAGYYTAVETGVGIMAATPVVAAAGCDDPS